MVLGEVTGKSQLKGNDFCQFYRDFQGHEIGLGVGVGAGMELSTKGKVAGCELACARHLAKNPLKLIKK